MIILVSSGLRKRSLLKLWSQNTPKFLQDQNDPATELSSWTTRLFAIEHRQLDEGGNE